jgi:predicted ATP-binding protein involved in virulence
VSIEEMTDSTPLRIKRIEVEGLFGLYHHVIDLNLEDRVTILHGPNGVGKSSLLWMLANTFHINFQNSSSRIYRIPFERYSIEFTDGGSTTIVNDPDHYDRMLVENTKYAGSIYVQLIESQRLFRCTYIAHSLHMESVIHQYAAKLHHKIQDVMNTYEKLSQNLDRTLPQRLLNRLPAQRHDLEQLKIQAIELNNKISELHEIGLLTETEISLFDLSQFDSVDEMKYAIMALYIEDTKQKLSVLDDFVQRIKLLINIVNRKFKHKKIKIHRADGFVIEGKLEGEYRNLPFTELLSSGEQHQIILIYNLLFPILPNSLILIDDPEISLHISWQKQFLSDLLEIVKISNFDVIIATHSPFIVGNRDDLMVALEEKLS